MTPGATATDTSSAAGAEIVSGGVIVETGSGLSYAPSTTNAVLSDGQIQYVLSGGIATSTTVSAGGLEIVSSSGVADFTAIAGRGASAVISSGGVTRSTTVSKGGYELVSSGGIASGTTVSSGSYQTVSSGGSATFATLSAYGTQVVSTGGTAISSFLISGGAQYIVSGGTAIGTIDSGALSYEDALSGSVASGSVIRGGRFDVNSSAIAVDTIISSGGHLNLFLGGTATGTVIDSGGVLSVVSGGVLDGTVMNIGGAIHLSDVAFDPSGTVSVDSGTDILTVVENGQTYNYQLAGDYYGTEFFDLASDGANGTTITEDGTPCYCRGTMILTARGEIAVEDLKIGDRLMTASGKARPIRWIGTRSYSGRFAAGNKDILPIMIEQGALANNVPKRDLWVSPLHAMFLDGVLIPASCLVNGVSIVQATRVDQVEYFHLELETHDVIVAEDALSESFLDDGSRGMFHNAATYREIYPDAARVPARYCAPRVEDGEALQAVRDRIAARSAQGVYPHDNKRSA